MQNWVLLRGLARQSGHWEDFPTLLEHSLGAHVLKLDYPGIGTDQAESCPKRLVEVVDYLEAKAKTKFKDSFYVLGISLGGMVAMKWLEMSSNVKGAVVINSSVPELCKRSERMIPKALRRFITCPMQKEMRQREAIVLGLCSNKHAHDNDVIDHWTQVSTKWPISLRVIYRQLIWSVQASLPQSRKEDVLLLASKYDKICHVNCTKKMGQMLEQPVYINKSAGHDLCLDDPQWVLEKMRAWLESRRESCQLV